VITQEQDPSAVLHHYRHVLSFRRNHPALRKGSMEQIDHTGHIVHFIRSEGAQTIFCAFNLSGEPGAMTLPTGTWRQIGVELGSAGVSPDGKLHLGPWQPSLMLKMD
jgi:alpha-glucosidase